MWNNQGDPSTGFVHESSRDISGFDFRSMLLAIGGGVVVLFIYGLVTRKAKS